MRKYKNLILLSMFLFLTGVHAENNSSVDGNWTAVLTSDELDPLADDNDLDFDELEELTAKWEELTAKWEELTKSLAKKKAKWEELKKSLAKKKAKWEELKKSLAKKRKELKKINKIALSES